MKRPQPAARLTLRVTLSASLMAIAAACHDSTSPNQLPDPSPVEGLWTASSLNPTVLRLSPAQLLTSGAQVPVTRIFTSSAALFEVDAIAFDTDGTMWVTSSDDSLLVAFAPQKLTQSGGTDATTLISSMNGSLSAPTGLAFDSQHRLWVANLKNGTIARFDRAELAAGGAAVPSVVISGPAGPGALAFDANGSLWVSNIGTNKIYSYSPAQLVAGGFQTPHVVLNSLGTTIVAPTGIAFDAAGNLWVANSNHQNLISLSPAQLATTSTPVPAVTISSNAGSLSNPQGVAFDSAGSLWVINSDGTVVKFSKASLASSGAPAPATKLTIAGYQLFWSAAFWPKPAGLPLN